MTEKKNVQTMLPETLRTICVLHNLFTSGTNENYDRLFTANDAGASTRELADIIHKYSGDSYSLDEIEGFLIKNSTPATKPGKAPAAPKTKKPAKTEKAPAKAPQAPAKGKKKAPPASKPGKVETSLTPAEKAKRQTQLEAITAYIRKATSDIAGAYMRIGYNLWNVKEHKLFLAVEVDGQPLKNVYEYAEIAFGFKSTSAKNFINVCERFSRKSLTGQPTDEIEPAFALFGYSQLSEILPLSDEKIKEVTPDMTIKAIRSLRGGQTSDRLTDSETPAPKAQKTVAYDGHVTAETYDRILDKLEKLMGKHIQIVIVPEN